MPLKQLASWPTKAPANLYDHVGAEHLHACTLRSPAAQNLFALLRPIRTLPNKVVCNDLLLQSHCTHSVLDKRNTTTGKALPTSQSFAPLHELQTLAIHRPTLLLATFMLLRILEPPSMLLPLKANVFRPAGNLEQFGRRELQPLKSKNASQVTVHFCLPVQGLCCGNIV